MSRIRRRCGNPLCGRLFFDRSPLYLVRGPTGPTWLCDAACLFDWAGLIRLRLRARYDPDLADDLAPEPMEGER